MTSATSTATNIRLMATKAVLWFLVGIACVVTFVRFARGLGQTTALTDTTPWGLWIGFDVLAGVALAAGGFVIAATVYIFGRERYHGILRPAILTAFLGYLAVIIGLLVDLGRPWNIWRPFFHWNFHSPLFEVAMCVIFYTAVLALEFAPVGLERFAWAQRLVRLLRKLTLPLVIAGICLSTLHQSSLGTLFLLAEGRMHPLWFSPILPPLFLVSAIGLGLGMVTLESLVSSWLYKREPEWPQLKGLTRAAAVVLGLYLVLRLGDLVWRGQIGHALDGSWFATLFWVEIVMSAAAPILLFSLPRTRGTRWAITWGAFLTVAGFILHRADVGGISHVAVTGEAYLPALSELAVSLGVVSGLGLVFLFFVENLQVWHEKPETRDHFAPPAVDPFSCQFIRAPWLGAGQRAALAWIFGAVVGLGIMETQVAARQDARARPVPRPRTVMVHTLPRPDGPGHLFRLAAVLDSSQAGPAGVQTALLLGTGDDSGFVLFGHQEHQARLGGNNSCGKCHHLNLPLDQGTSCSHCHDDMYRVNDTFDHGAHVTAHGGKQACAVCHLDPAAVKDRDPVDDRPGAKPCADCHQPTAPEITLVRGTGNHRPGMAPGFKTAMHRLCLDCHLDHEKTAWAAEPYLSRCTTCHRHLTSEETATASPAARSLAAVAVQP